MGKNADYAAGTPKNNIQSAIYITSISNINPI
jgi:hypothetical protein